MIGYILFVTLYATVATIIFHNNMSNPNLRKYGKILNILVAYFWIILYPISFIVYPFVVRTEYYE